MHYCVAKALAFFGGALATALIYDVTNTNSYTSHVQTMYRQLVYVLRPRAIFTGEANFSNLTSSSGSVVASAAARRLPLRGSIFCWVLTAPIYYKTRVPAVNQTWLPRCDHGEFFTKTKIDDETIPYRTVFSRLNDTYTQLFWKTREALYYSYKHISDKFDWYVKADDDAYLIMDNLREFLSQYNASDPYFFGYRMAPYLKRGYNSGGTYVLSNGAMRIFADNLYNDSKLCPCADFEDMGIALCFENAGIFPSDTRDSEGRQRFLAYTLDQHIRGDKMVSGWSMDPVKKGMDGISGQLINLHHATPDQMRLADFFLYHVRRTGNDDNEATKSKSLDII